MERGPDGGHWRARDLAATDIDFELGGDERLELRGHLACCDACRRWAAGLQADAVALVDLAFAELTLSELGLTSLPAPRPVGASGGRYNPAR